MESVRFSINGKAIYFAETLETLVLLLTDEMFILDYITRAVQARQLISLGIGPDVVENLDIVMFEDQPHAPLAMEEVRRRRANDIHEDIHEDTTTEGENVASPETPKSSSTTETRMKWKPDSIKLLIDLRLGMEKEFINPKCKKSKLWTKIVEQMRTIGGYQVNNYECDSKYRNLLHTYRQNKEKTKTTGEGKILWEYFEVFDEILGHKASSCPPDNILTPSIKVGKNNSDEENKQKTKKKISEYTMNQYLKLKHDRKEKKWNERKDLKKQEIEAIRLLADAIKATAGASKNDKKKSKRPASDSDSD